MLDATPNSGCLRIGFRFDPEQSGLILKRYGLAN